ncbi:MAG: tetratricopeptide repeat protein [Bacteroidota bacterium]
MKYIFFIAISILLFSCSAEKTNVVSVAFHNTTAHYNAYFYANEQMNEIETYIKDNHDNNYNKILSILPRYDSTTAVAMESQIEECIKKASIAIQRHQNSKWVDDSYILVGKARMYGQEFVDAVETFKYVNTKGESDDDKHEALVNLIRTFVENNEFNNAIAVSDYLKKERLNRDNLKNLHMARAYLYQRRDDYNSLVQNLVLAVPLLSRSEGKARVYFIIGQVYQKLGFDAQAYNNYGLCLKSNPDFELAFYAKLNRAQVVELSDNSDVRRVEKYFKKLLKDRKNREFQDKIYYEMGNFELKQDKVESAISFYDKSIQASTTNNRQKAYSYLSLANIYYDRKAEYELSKLYYDSVLTVLPKSEENYVQIEDRQKILANFVKQLNTIKLQDSLLYLASLDEKNLDLILQGIVDEKKKEEEEKALKEKQRRRAQTSSFLNEEDKGFEISTEGEWYFFNSNALSKGQSEFERLWGRRKLEDNWRRSQKEVTISSTSNIIEDVDDNKNIDLTSESVSEVTDEQQKQNMRTSIPFTEEAKAQAHKAIEDALYNLGNIYNFDLKELTNAIVTFENLLSRYPDTEYEPEVLYELYLISLDIPDANKAAKYKDALLQKYPDSEFSKVLLNPNYKQESRLASERLKKSYKIAYKYFERENYDTANYILKTVLLEEPENSFSDNLRLLQILILGKTDGIERYQYELDEFIKSSENEELKSYALNLRSMSDEVRKEIKKRRGISYTLDFAQNHAFIFLYQTDNKAIQENVTSILKEFLNKNEMNKLTAANLVYNEELGLALIEPFTTKTEALEFLKIFKEDEAIRTSILGSSVGEYVVSKENFDTFYENKDHKGYKKFFNNHYYY